MSIYLHPESMELHNSSVSLIYSATAVVIRHRGTRLSTKNLVAYDEAGCGVDCSRVSLVCRGHDKG